MLLLSSPPDRHSPIEDVIGFLSGTVLVAISVQFLQAAGLITGQIAGLSLILAYMGGWSFGIVFFLLNLPFYAFALARMGVRFTLKTFLAVGLLSLFTDLLGRFTTLEVSHPAIAALAAGILASAGLVILFRHGASLGGVGIMALYLQDKAGIRAGIVQLGFDLGVLVLALFLFPLPVVVWSFAGAALLNVVIALNHRRDRYIAK